MRIRTVLVDDEALARSRLRKFLAQEADVEIVGECSNGPEAVGCIRQQQPDVIFLDMHMPELDGLEVIRALPAGCVPAIVFVTAHDEHAVEAFAVQATDYLLKPFTRARLQEAVRRVRQRLQSPAPPRPAAPLAAEPRPPWLNRFAVKDGNQTLFIKIQDVDYIEAAANYAVLCTASGNHVVRETLRNLESSLSPGLFLRISRSVIVSLDRIKAIRSDPPGEWVVVLEGGREFLMTRGLKEVQTRLQYSAGLRSSF
ncbi:MAG: response regulator transcription factor [Verrucomicrobiota bacterium]|jgi:two-component system LytT family response regulator